MHNPHMIVALGVYITVLFVGMAIGMSVTSPSMKTLGADAKKSRVDATVAGAVVGLVFAITYAVVLRAKHKMATYYSTLLILFFGLWYTVYMLFPKTYDTPTTAVKTMDAQYAIIGTHAVALGLAFFAYFIAWKFMKN